MDSANLSSILATPGICFYNAWAIPLSGVKKSPYSPNYPQMPRIALSTIFYLSLATILWAGNAIAGRVLVGSISPITLSSVRWGLAALMLLPFGWRVLRPDSALWQNKARFLVLGLLGVGSYNALLYLALQTSTAINVTLIGASMPIWMLFIGAVFYKVRPTLLQLVGAIVSLVGVSIVLTRGEPASLLSMQVVMGDLLIMLATILWAFYSWMISRPGRSNERQWPWAEFLMAQVLIGFMWTMFFEGAEIAAGQAFIGLNYWTVGLIIFIAIGPSLVAYRCWGLGVSEAGPTVAAFFANLIPLFTALLSAAMLGDPPKLFHGLAFLLIVGGIIISSARGQR
jgi:drug/metabolite transporter (DMT)-like permease